jgi:hypothetical protein
MLMLELGRQYWETGADSNRENPTAPMWQRHEESQVMELIPISGAEIYYDPHFFQPEEATPLFNTLLSKCAWERRRANYGHAVPESARF